MTIVPNAGIIDFGTFISPEPGKDGIQGQVPAPLVGQELYLLSASGWVVPSSGSGTVTSVSGTGTVNGITLTGTVTTSGSLTLGGTLSVDLSTATVTGTLPVTHGGTGATTLTNGRLLVGQGTSAVASSLVADNGTTITVNGRTTLAAPNSSAAAWTTAGINLVQSAATFTDTTSTGTVADIRINNFAAQTLAASNATTVTSLYNTYFTAPVAGTNVTAGNVYAVGADTLRVAGTTLISVGTTTGQFVAGGSTMTGTITLGQSTVSQTTNIQAAATASGSTKTINLGTGGLSGSTTTITIGSTTGTSTTINGTLNAASTLNVAAGLNVNGITSNTNIGTSQTTGLLTLGNTAGTGTITLGQSTVSQTTNIQAGATASGSTKTINLGTGGAAGSTTTITIGSTAGTSTTTVNGTVVLSNALAVSSGGTGATTLTGVVIGNGASAFTTVTAPSGAIVGTTDTQTLTNKRYTPRVSSTASITSPLAWNSDNFDQYAATAQSTAFTISADAGTPTDGQKSIFRILDNGTSRVITFTGGASKAFRPVGVTLTVSGSDFTYTTTANKTVYFGCIYNSAASRWDIIALSLEA